MEIAQAIGREKKPKKMKALLNRLKLRLNYYGKCYDKYLDSLKLDFFRDQHIWEIIDRIEKGEGDLEDDKIKLLDCLGLLLKYDWERTKRETTINFGIIISAIVYFLGVFANILDLYLVLKSDNMIIAFIVIFNIISYLCFLLPYLFGKHSYFKSDKQLKETYTYWVTGGICWVLTESITYILLHNKVNFWCIGIGIFVAGIAITMCIVMRELVESQRYRDKVIECLKFEKVKIFYYKDEDKVLWARMNLEKWNLNSKFYNIKDADEELDAIINILKKKEILKRRYRIGYFIYKIKESKGMKDYIRKHPKSTNIILEYKGNYTVGCSEKKIDKLILDEIKTEEPQ